MIRLIGDGTISGKMAKEVVDGMCKSGKPPKAIIAEKGLVQITDEGALTQTIAEIIAKNRTSSPSTGPGRRSSSASSWARR